MTTLIVDFSQPLAEQASIGWASAKDGALRDLFAWEQPHAIVIRRTDGQTFESSSKTTTMQQADGYLTSVTILPLDDARPYQQALADLRAVLARNDVLTTDLEPTLRQWAAHGASGPAMDPAFPGRLSTRTEVGGTNIGITLRPAASGGWFYALNIDRPRD